jgi:hypothetical protein
MQYGARRGYKFAVSDPATEGEPREAALPTGRGPQGAVVQDAEKLEAGSRSL